LTAARVCPCSNASRTNWTLSAEASGSRSDCATRSPCCNGNGWKASGRAAQDPETSGAEGLRDLAAAYARPITPDEVLAGTADTYQREIDLHYGLI
jgi:hypothetical protein